MTKFEFYKKRHYLRLKKREGGGITCLSQDESRWLQSFYKKPRYSGACELYFEDKPYTLFACRLALMYPDGHPKSLIQAARLKLRRFGVNERDRNS